MVKGSSSWAELVKDNFKEAVDDSYKAKTDIVEALKKASQTHQRVLLQTYSNELRI